ncbi:MAG: UDP-N-acetylmuramoylalanine--D-glutamate ligase [Acidimicrobiaceae bacterium]|nr:UDP-N-acetylmuramoylalanine--D-glutamate ligase [Acidimicrobiaceae bacterium]
MSGASADAVVVVGFRVTGRAVVAFLRQRGDRVVIVEDDPTDERRQQAAALGATFVARPDTDELRRILAGSRLVVPSPGIPVRHPVYAAAAATGVAVHSELELGFERLRDRPAAERPALVAITGTNGKTTVTSLVAAMIVSSGLVAVAAGNIGLPFIDAAALVADVLVAEVSSFQLQYTDAFHPAVSCWLNLAEDHLDWHPTAAHYAAAKARVWARQGPGDTAVVNRDDPAVAAAAADADHGVPAGVEVVTFGLAAGDYRQDTEVLIGPGGVPLVKSSELTRSLPLDVANALAATATARAVGASIEGCQAALRQFTALPHRVELVAERDGVRWYDDSKSTTPASVLAAVAGFESVVLIAGGRNKGLDLGVLAQAAPRLRAVVAIGEAAAEVEAAFSARVPVTRADSMAAAVAAAAHDVVPGDAVLLSPGCASFDWYRSYAERGEEFTTLVAELVGQGSLGSEENRR